MSASSIRYGYISDYNEQGMEGDFHVTFQDAACINGDGRFDREGWFILSDGDRLTIHRPDGTVLWRGGIGAPPQTASGWLQHWARQWIHGRRRWAPEGVSDDMWISWFRARPCHRATFSRPAANAPG